MLEPHGEAGIRERTGAGLRPLHEYDRVLEVRLQVSPLRSREAHEAIEVEMRDVDLAGVAVTDSEGGARDRLGHAESAAGAADERRLPRAELARDRDDVADAEPLGEAGGERLGLPGGGRGDDE